MKTELPSFSKRDNNDLQKKDNEQKRKMKEYADSQNRSKESSLMEGDVVLVRQKKVSKTTPPFDPNPYMVVRRMGNTIVAKRGNRVIKRNISFFKRVQIKPSQMNEDVSDLEDDFDLEITRDAQPNAPPGAPPPPRPILRRSGRQPKQPVRFRDYVMDSDSE